MRLSRKLFPVSERLLIVLWVGGLWITGFVVAPTLFSILDDRALAGTIAGAIFTHMSYIGLVCGSLLLLAGWRTYRPIIRWVIGAMLALVLVNQFVLQPEMAALRATGIDEGTPSHMQFARLHGVSSILFLLTSVLGLYLATAERGTSRDIA